MNFVLDASVTMSWLLGDSKASDRAYAGKILEELKNPDTSAAVPVTWSLEVANVIARAEAKGLVSRRRARHFWRCSRPPQFAPTMLPAARR